MVDARLNAEATAATPRLGESDLDLIQRTLQACDGNASDAAVRLGVSRSLIPASILV